MESGLQSDEARVLGGELGDMVWIPGGVFQMGSDRHYPEEAPVSQVRVDGFFIDPYLVTNRQFAAFVAATGYRTVARESSIGRLFRTSHRQCCGRDRWCSTRREGRWTCAT